MLETIRKKGFLDAMLKHMIFFALFFPMITSKMKVPYAPDMMLVNGFAVLFLAGMAVQKAVHFPAEKRLGVVLLVLTVVLNLILGYINLTKQHWYWGQLNVTLPLVLFWMLMGRRESELEGDPSIVRFLIQAVVLSTLIGFVFYTKDILSVQLIYGKVELVPMTSRQAGGERRFHWLYYHKSQYSLMLLLFLGVMISNRRLFQKQWMLIASIGVMLIGLVISHAITSIMAAGLILAGWALDALRKRYGGFPRKLLWLLIPLAAVAAAALYVIGQQRDLLSLGARLPIWRESIPYLKENFWGFGEWAGSTGFVLDASKNWGSNNCHNVFLNWMLQFSIPGGFCLTAILMAIFVAAFRKNPCFTSAGILLALLMPMTMDWSVLISDMPMLMIGLYFIFFGPTGHAGLKALQTGGISPSCD